MLSILCGSRPEVTFGPALRSALLPLKDDLVHSPIPDQRFECEQIRECERSTASDRERDELCEISVSLQDLAASHQPVLPHSSKVMSSKGTNLTNKRLSSETDHAQRLPDTEPSQQMRLRERQRFFEEVFQHDVDVYLSPAHLQIDYKRPPLGSISSMEVNVDMLEQMELLDISDQEALDVFFSASGEESALTSTLPALSHTVVEEDEFCKDLDFTRIPDSCEFKTRMLSTSSNSTCDSQASNEDGSNTPIIHSDDEDVHEECSLQIGTPTAKGATIDQSVPPL